MREIKFRAWDKVNKAFMSSEEFAIHDGDVMGLRYGNEMDDVLTDQVELMQYTGLKDINGVEMFDGDVVEVNIQEYVLGYYTETKYTSLIRYKDGSYYFDILKSETIQTDINDYPLKDIINLEDVESDDCEVIGNKFENPELLEVD